jgi:hypothetical protein
VPVSVRLELVKKALIGTAGVGACGWGVSSGRSAKGHQDDEGDADEEPEQEVGEPGQEDFAARAAEKFRGRGFEGQGAGHRGFGGQGLAFHASNRGNAVPI